MKSNIVHPPVFSTENFVAWNSGFGLLMHDQGSHPSFVYGFESVTQENWHRKVGETTQAGACFGFIQRGVVRVRGNRTDWILHAGQFFSSPAGVALELQRDSVALVVQRCDYYGMNFAGGPVESLGRLRYIDGCSDTLLISPPLRGEPCLNLLHFPTNIDQTAHTHPSSRIGIVKRGGGRCVTPAGSVALVPGLFFHIPTNGVHKFQTDREDMDVIAYHPDSDFGPTHQEHPMVNRTLVDGSKIDNSTGRHASAQFISSDLAAARAEGKV